MAASFDVNSSSPAGTLATRGSGRASGTSRLLVLLFTDLVGSTGLKGTLTTAGYVPLLRRHDALLREAVASTGGQLQQDTGDGCFACFTTSSDAVKAALIFQWSMNAEPWPEGARLSARAGIHLGEVAQTEVRQEGGGKLVGMAVDLAARVMSLAQGGQILLTRSAFDDARQFITAHPGSQIAALRWVAHGPYLFKGSDEPLDVFEVGVNGQSPLAPPPDSEKARRALRPGEEQTLGWRPAIGLPLPGSPLWVLERKLGEGSFGEVWLARHVKAKSVRVFKFCFDADRLRALKREVVLFRLLKEALGDRRDISRVIDWQFDEPPYFIEMEFVAGGNLLDWAQKQGGIDKIPLPDRLKITAQVATALSAAHSVGILHKDIKPSNVVMGEDAEGVAYPRLTDFGIGILTDRSRLKDFNVTDAGFTAPNLTMNEPSRTGTRMYAPPESLANRPHTVQGDVYALGVLLYQMAVGDLVRPLGVGWERDISDQILRDDIADCVEGDPQRRLASAAELVSRISSLEPRREQKRQAEAARAKTTRRRTLVRTALLASVGISILMAVAFFHEREIRKADSQTQQARQLSDLQSLFDAYLESQDWSETRQLKLRQTIGELSGLDRRQGTLSHKRMVLVYRDHLAGQMHSPELSDTDAQAIERGLVELSSEDPAVAQELRNEWLQRRREWQTMFSIGPGSADLAAVFNPADVRAKADHLEPQSGNSKVPVLTEVPCTNNCELDAVFKADTIRGSSVALLLNCRKDSQYVFELVALPQNLWAKNY